MAKEAGESLSADAIRSFSAEILSDVSLPERIEGSLPQSCGTVEAPDEGPNTGAAYNGGKLWEMPGEMLG